MDNKFLKLFDQNIIGFENDPSWLEQELLSIGLVTDETEWAMICDLEKQKPLPIGSDFDIRQVQDRAEIKNVISVINQIIPVDEHLAIQSFYEQSAAILLSKNCSLTFFIPTFLDLRSDFRELFHISKPHSFQIAKLSFF